MSEQPRPSIHAISEALIADFRAHGGRVTQGPFVGRDVLILTTTGARSGLPRTVPLVYSCDAGRHVIVASRGGAPAHPAWYFNLVANPVVTVEAGPETYRARAVVVDGAERDRLYAQHAERNPSFNDYQARTSRRIPVIVLERLA